MLQRNSVLISNFKLSVYSTHTIHGKHILSNMMFCTESATQIDTMYPTKSVLIARSGFPKSNADKPLFILMYVRLCFRMLLPNPHRLRLNEPGGMALSSSSSSSSSSSYSWNVKPPWLPKLSLKLLLHRICTKLTQCTQPKASWLRGRDSLRTMLTNDYSIWG